MLSNCRIGYSPERMGNLRLYVAFFLLTHTLPSHLYSPHVGNSQKPELLQTMLVNIYLYQADSGERIHAWKDITNPVGRAGAITAYVNDSWWGDRGEAWTPTSGDKRYPFYWGITRNDKPEASVIPLPIFTAVRE